MSKLNNKRPMDILKDLTINVNGDIVNFGKLAIIKPSICGATGKVNLRLKCIRTGKTFTDIRKFSSHIVELMLNNKEIIFKDK